MDPGNFCNYLTGWREWLREVLCTDPQDLIHRRNPACAENITDAFPDPEVVYSYLSPLTSLSHAQPLPSINSQLLPDVAQIGELCEQYFEWATPADILLKFLKHIWPGVVFQMVCKDIMKTDERQGLAAASTHLRIPYFPSS
jgi:hypothetical protein